MRDGGAHADAALVALVMQTLSVYGYGALPADPAHSQAKVRGYAAALDDCPLWALEAAGRWFVKKQTEAPTPAEWIDRAWLEAGRHAWLWYGDGPTEWLTAGQVFARAEELVSRTA